MGSNIKGKIYDIQGFSVQDGPGIRTTVFLKGCPLRCPWCHSPESQRFDSQLSWLKIKCVGIDLCGECLNVCPHNAISPGQRQYSELKQQELQLIEIDFSLCDDCGECVKKCYAKALYMSGEDYTVEEVLERVLKDKAFYDSSGGGVTISGGEPLAQPEFTIELLKACKKEGLHTALDTTGFVKWEWIKEALPYTDLFLYDLKNMNSDLHEKIIGVRNETILENALKIAEAGGKFQIRIPIIPMFSDSEENIKETGEFCKKLGNAVDMIQLLPYHNLGVVKYERIKHEGPILEAVPPKQEKVNSLKAILEDMGLKVTVH